MTWAGTTGTILKLEHPSLIVRDSHFPVSGGGEIIHGENIAGDEYLIIDGNTFENSNNGGDVIDVLGADRPGPVVQILNNVFKGGGDDGLDLDGTDAHIEGNVFMNFRKNTSRATTSNAIATGLPQTGAANRTEITVVRNIFFNNDHSLLLKEDAFATIDHNVFVDTAEAVIQFDEVGGTSVLGPGKGAKLNGNIFLNNASLFKNLVNDDGFRADLSVFNSILPNEDVDFGGTIVKAHRLGDGNLDADPRFIDVANMNFRLRSDSPARGAAGIFGLDMGAYVDAGPRVAEIRTQSQPLNEAKFQVGGPGISHYRYRIDGGSWSELAPVEEQIRLANMQNGDYGIEIIGMNSAGEWFSHEAPAYGELTGHIIAPKEAVIGESIPAIVRVYDHRGDLASSYSMPIEAFGVDPMRTYAVDVKRGTGTAFFTPLEASDVELSLPDKYLGNARIDGESDAIQSKTVRVRPASLPGNSYSGTVEGDIVWSEDAYILEDVTIPQGSTLTIEAGRRVLFNNRVNLTVNGTLIVNGTDADPVHFSSRQSGSPWGGLRVQNGHAEINYAFFTAGGADTSQTFGHSNSQPVIRADSSTLRCDNCFVINNIGKGFASTNDSIVEIHQSVISNNDTGGEFVNSVVRVTETMVKDIPNGDGVFADDDNDGFYFSGVHSSGEPSLFKDSTVLNTKDDGLDHNGAMLRVEGAWIEGALHEGIASSNQNSVHVFDSVFRRNNQGVEAGYGSPDLNVSSSVIIDNLTTADPDSQITAGVRFGDGYDGSNGAYRGHVTATNLVVWNNGDNIRNYDGTIPGPQAAAIDIAYSLTNDEDYDDDPGNVTGIPVLGRSMHLLRGSAGFAGTESGLPLGREVSVVSHTFTIDSDLPSLQISEFAANVVHDDQRLNGAVELANTGSTTISLEGLRLTDNLDDPNKFHVPGRFNRTRWLLRAGHGRDAISAQSSRRQPVPIASRSGWRERDRFGGVRPTVAESVCCTVRFGGLVVVVTNIRRPEFSDSHGGSQPAGVE